MAKSVISYDKDLPEIPGRCPWQPPTSFLVKEESAPGGWIEKSDEGRRPSRLLLIKKLRAAVDQWRADGYPFSYHGQFVHQSEDLPNPDEIP